MGSGQRIVILWSPLNIEPIVDRRQNRQHFMEELRIQRRVGPLGPLTNILRIRRADNASRQLLIGNREL